MLPQDDVILVCLKKIQNNFPIKKGELTRAFRRHSQLCEEIDTLRQLLAESETRLLTTPFGSGGKQTKQSEDSINKLRKEIARLRDSQQKDVDANQGLIRVKGPPKYFRPVTVEESADKADLVSVMTGQRVMKKTQPKYQTRETREVSTPRSARFSSIPSARTNRQEQLRSSGSRFSERQEAYSTSHIRDRNRETKSPRSKKVQAHDTGAAVRKREVRFDADAMSKSDTSTSVALTERLQEQKSPRPVWSKGAVEIVSSSQLSDRGDKTRMSQSETGDVMSVEERDITDPFRPLRIVEDFTYIYNDEWRRAYEEMSDQRIDEGIIIGILANIAKEAYAFCLNLAKQQMEELWEQQEFVLENIIARPGRRHAHGYNKQREGHVLLDRRQMDETDKYLRFYRQIMSGKSLPGLRSLFRKSQTVARLQEQARLSTLPEEIETYVDAVLAVSWRMAIREPPLHQIWAERGQAVDKDRFVFFLLPGKIVRQTVWPAVALRESGSLLAKGVVEVILP